MTFAVGDLLLLTLLACFTSYKLFFSRKYPHSLPPGPKGWPLIGNAFDMPKSHSWRTFAQWGKKWGRIFTFLLGPIMSVKVLGTPFIIISNPDIADEMLGKTGSLYADRPTVQMALLTGWDRALSGARYNARFREYRKLIGKVIGTKGSMAKFYPVEDFQANMLLKRIFQNPEDPAAAIRKSCILLTFRLAQVKFKAMEQFSDIHRTGAYLVEFFPILKYVPSWSPFAEFKRKAVECIGPCNEMADVPFAYVEEQLGKGEENNSFAADLLKDKSIPSEKLTDLKWSAASFYAAGSDTTVSVVYSYLMAAILYPQVQRMAQAEVDSVVGKDRLPSFQDRDSLPYIEALVKELYRWLPIVPLAVPHRAMKDNVFRGYYIPKDSLVFVNVWHFLHDPAVYKNPSSFNPERFLGPDAEPNPIDRGLFGYGRRVCPGAHLARSQNCADVSVWINIVKAVAGIEVSPAVDEKGQAKMPVPETTDGIIVRPIPFECLVKPRSEHLLHVLEEALKDAENVN
ncbi:cytochrome P450 [Lentinula lateritia]|uniref:Cytochrome P450 n=1 Tax=Lentinula aff. lateritia TaxID=2804960 RepID=A0ACC1UB44_9AGAR|nr:cytochrome P450 [Lentinula aff. lateritia]KAJ3855404.1 cytochrome P450 [Lentinula lateritia]